MAKLFILGAGGFGTALAVMSQANGHEVTMWSYREDEAAQLRTDRENRRLLPGVKISEEIAIVTDFAALGEAELVLIAVPSSAVRSVSAQLHGRLAPGAVVVCVSKGFEPETLKRMDEVIAEELPKNPCVILSGPSHAEEVAKGIPTTVVAACRDLDMAERVQMTSRATPSASMSPMMSSGQSWAAPSRMSLRWQLVPWTVWVWGTTPRRR